jgi:hypothetical protein
MDARERIYEEPCGCRVDITGIVVHRCLACEREEMSRNGMPYVPPIAPHDGLFFERTPSGPRVILRHNLGEVEIKFDPRYARHSPTGFEWGYGGSGPAELARYLTYGVARYLGISPDRWDLFDYQVVKWEFVARIPHHGGGYHASEIYEALGLSHYLQEPEW